MAKFNGGTNGKPGRSEQMGHAFEPTMCRVRSGDCRFASSISPLAVWTATFGMIL